MPSGRRTALRIQLPDDWRRQLETWQRCHRRPVGLVRRGRIILLLADGMPVTHVAAMVGIQRCHVYKWARRFQALGLDGLLDARIAARLASTRAAVIEAGRDKGSIQSMSGYGSA